MVFPFKSLEDFKIEISQDHELLRSAVRDFSENVLAKYVEKGEKELDIPIEVKIKAKEIGLYGLFLDQQLGGQGADYLSLLVASEEISRVWPSFSTFLLIDWMFIYTLSKFGSDELKKKYIPPVAQGEKVGAFANTEPTAGSDVAGIKTTAKKINSGEYVINGRKIFITNGDIADYYIVTARTSPPDPNARWKGISMFVVEREWKGVKVLNRIETMGLKASNTAELAFEDVEVPAENLIGEEGMGFKYAMATFDRTRVGVAAQAVGVAQAALEKMVTYVTQRFAFQSPLIGFQMVQEKIAESLTEVNTARLLTYWAASLFDRRAENEAIIAASMAKFYATEIAEKVAIRAITVHGGYGVATSTGVERLLRDVEVMKIYEGTNDIQKLTILRETARRLLGLKL